MIVLGFVAAIIFALFAYDETGDWAAALGFIAYPVIIFLLAQGILKALF